MSNLVNLTLSVPLDELLGYPSGRIVAIKVGKDDLMVILVGNAAEDDKGVTGFLGAITQTTDEGTTYQIYQFAFPTGTACFMGATRSATKFNTLASAAVKCHETAMQLAADKEDFLKLMRELLS